MNILITGGVSSGKSNYAESRLLAFPTRHVYIATMERVDKECEDKIAKHIARREGLDIEVIESPTSVDKVDLDQNSTVLLECLTTLTSNEIFKNHNGFDEIFDSILALSKKCNNLIVVTNEVGCGIGNYSEETLKYIQILGRLNCVIASIFDEVIELKCGIPNIIKGQ